MRELEKHEVMMTNIVMPNDTNHLGKLMGGNLMKWMDVCAAMCGMKYCENPVVTVSADHMTFKTPIELGEIVTLKARISRTFRTSFEVCLEVWAENYGRNKRKSNDAFFTFVSVDPQKGTPISAPSFVPKGEHEVALHESAMRRRQLRLIMAGRMDPNEAKDLKRLFV